MREETIKVYDYLDFCTPEWEHRKKAVKELLCEHYSTYTTDDVVDGIVCDYLEQAKKWFIAPGFEYSVSHSQSDYCTLKFENPTDDYADRLFDIWAGNVVIHCSQFCSSISYDWEWLETPDQDILEAAEEVVQEGFDRMANHAKELSRNLYSEISEAIMQAYSDDDCFWSEYCADQEIMFAIINNKAVIW